MYDLHAIPGHFPAGLANFGIGLARFIQNRIGVVDVEKNLARAFDVVQGRERPAWTRQRKVPHRGSWFAAASASHAGQLVFGPEGAIKQNDVALVQPLTPRFFDFGRARQIRHASARA